MFLGKVANSNFPPSFVVNKFYTKNIPARSSVNMLLDVDKLSWKKGEIEEKVNSDTKNYWDELMDSKSEIQAIS